MQPTPPKSADKLRSALEAIRGQAPNAVPGPLKEGLKDDDRLVIASFYDPDVRRRYQELLMAHNIGSTHERRDGKDRVLIDAGDREQAAKLRDEHLLAHPDRMQARGRRVIDFSLLGGVLGATISAIFVVDRVYRHGQWQRMVLPVLGFTLYGAIVGGLLGVLKERFANRGRLQFTILDLFLLAALVALASLAWRMR